MSRRFSVQPEAKEDIASAAQSLRMKNARAGERFVELVQKYLELIERNPLLFGVLFDDIRAVTIRKYRYVIVYCVQDHRTDLLAVVHGSQDMSSWEHRIPK